MHSKIYLKEINNHNEDEVQSQMAGCQQYNKEDGLQEREVEVDPPTMPLIDLTRSHSTFLQAMIRKTCLVGQLVSSIG